MKGSEIFHSLMKKDGVEISAQDSIRLANFLTGMINAHDYVRKERDDSERSRTELIKQNAALAAENERMEAELARLPAKWSEDSSLKTWFPLTSEMYERVLLENVSLRAVIKAAQSQSPAAYMLEFNVDGDIKYSPDLSGRLDMMSWECDGIDYPAVSARPLYFDPVPAQSPETRSSLPDNVTRVVDASTGQVKQRVPAGAVPDDWREAVQEFVDRCEIGNIRSKYTYAKFKALLNSSQSHDRCASHEPQSAPARSPQDYAIEHAEYMAVNGEQLLSYLNTISDEDEGTLVPDDRFSDYISGLRSGIYEFRKRRDRCQHGVQDSGVVDHE